MKKFKIATFNHSCANSMFTDLNEFTEKKSIKVISVTQIPLKPKPFDGNNGNSTILTSIVYKEKKQPTN